MRKIIKQEWLQDIVEVYSERMLNPTIIRQECADKLNEKFNCNFSESAWRKSYQSYNMAVASYTEKLGMEKVLTEEEYDKKIKHIAKARARLMFESKVNQETSKVIHRDLRKAARFSIIDDMFIELSEYEYQVIKRSSVEIIDKEDTKQMPVYCMSDLHYGWESNKVSHNIYNPEVSKQRVFDFADYIISDVKKNKYKQFIILDGGDIIEGAGNLRVSQLLETKMTLTEQTIGAIDLLTNFYTYINNSLINQTFNPKATVYMLSAGNHSEVRVAGTKRNEVKNDNMAILICDSIAKSLKAMGETIYTTRINSAIDKYDDEIVQEDLIQNYIYADEHIFNILGNISYLAHGDQYKFGTDIHDRLAKKENVLIDYAIVGHWHSYTENTVGSRDKKSKRKITLPSFCGDTPYGLDLGLSSVPGGLKIIFDSVYGAVSTTFIPIT